LIVDRARRGGARVAAALLFLLILATLAPSRLSRPAPFLHDASIRVDPVPLDASAPGRRRIGGLVYLGGWQLSSANRHFGGISAMHVGPGDVIALNDAGSVIRFPLPHGPGMVRARIDPLGDGPGSPDIKQDRDTEALAIFGGRAWVGYERRDAIWRYRTSDWRSDAHAEPEAMRRWPNNAGSEAIVRLRDGRFLVFSEGQLRRDGTSEVLLFEGDPALADTRYISLGYRPPRSHVPTDAALLPDGRLLILNRRVSFWDGISAKVTIAALPEQGDLLAGTEIATLRAPLTVDNMEAVSITREGGRTILWLASDDNFSPPLQRTLLLKFALGE
jgi:hypothetical protein